MWDELNANADTVRSEANLARIGPVWAIVVATNGLHEGAWSTKGARCSVMLCEVSKTAPRTRGLLIRNQHANIEARVPPYA
jgi:hypothetical protein